MTYKRTHHKHFLQKNIVHSLNPGTVDSAQSGMPVAWRTRTRGSNTVMQTSALHPSCYLTRPWAAVATFAGWAKVGEKICLLPDPMMLKSQDLTFQEDSLLRHQATTCEQVCHGSQCKGGASSLLCWKRDEYIVFGTGAHNTSAVVEVLITEG